MKPQENIDINKEGTAKRSQRSWIVIGSVIVAILVIAALLFMLYTGYNYKCGNRR